MLVLWIAALGTRAYPRTALVLGGALLAVYGARAILGPRPRWFGLRLWAAIAMLGMSVADAFILAPRIAVSIAVLLATVVTGVGLAWAEFRDTPS